MDISTTEVRGASILHITGEIDLYTIHKISDELNRIYEEKDPRIILDFKEVMYVDSTGIGLLLTEEQKSRQNGGYLRLVAVPDSVHKVFRQSKLDGHFQFFESEEQAAD